MILNSSGLMRSAKLTSMQAVLIYSRALRHTLLPGISAVASNGETQLAAMPKSNTSAHHYVRA